MSVGGEVAAGAIGAGSEIAAAAVDMVQNAAESIAHVATGGVRALSPDDSKDTNADPEREGRGEGKGS